MKQLPGVIFSAIVLILGSLFQLMMAVFMGFGGAIEMKELHSDARLGAGATASLPSWMPLFTFAFSALFIALAAWGILTAVGLFRIRRWARYSVLVIGGCLAMIGLPAMLLTLIMFAVPLPIAPGAGASQTQTIHTMSKFIFVFVAVFYGIMSAVGISWLAYFNLKSVRAAFLAGQGPLVESRRPFLISIIAVLSIIGAVACLLMALIPLPGAFLGLILNGWQRAVLYLVYAALLAAAGVGLWRLQEWGRRLALAMQVVGLLQYAVYLVHPSLLVRYSQQIDQKINLTEPQQTLQVQTVLNNQTIFYVAAMGFGITFLIVIIWVLMRYRNAFVPPAAPTAAHPSSTTG